MPVLNNVRHERFSQELARGSSANRAYEIAGYKPDDGHASRLAGNGKVKERINELQSDAAKSIQLDRTAILRMLIEDHEMARRRGQSAAAIKAIELLGRELCRMFVDRKEVGTPGQFQYQNMTESQLNERLAQEFEALGKFEIAAVIRRTADS